MKLVERSDLLDRKSYDSARDDLRARVMKIKSDRRVSVGPYFTFLFENRDTVLYQIQEMIRAEGIIDDAAVAHEIETYNQLVPGAGSLSATLLLEIEDPIVRKVKLAELVGLERHVKLVFDGCEVEAEFDEGQLDPSKISSVQYIRFVLGADAAAFKQAARARIVITHPAAGYSADLPPGTLAALREDMRS